MSTTDIEVLGARLDETHQALMHSLRERDEIAIENTANALDRLLLGGEPGFAVSTAHAGSNLLRQIRRAQARIERGSFGTCLRCDEEISPTRLNAVPWASCCTDCQ